MSTFLKLLPLELQEIKTYSEPHVEVGDNDHTVGTMSDELKKLYTLYMSYLRRAEELKLEARFGQIADTVEHSARTFEMKSKAEVLAGLFWVGVNDAFSLWTKPSSGVRKGYTVVWSDSEDNDLSSFLQKLFDL